LSDLIEIQIDGRKSREGGIIVDVKWAAFRMGSEWRDLKGRGDCGKLWEKGEWEELRKKGLGELLRKVRGKREKFALKREEAVDL